MTSPMMAPTISIDAISIVRPLKVVACVCGIMAGILMLLALSASSWLQAAGWRQGLFEHCIKPNAPQPLPFETDNEPGCHPARKEPYIVGTAALCIICLILDIAATVLTSMGLNANDLGRKAKLYRNAIWLLTLALIAVLIALIVYPVCFAKELALGNRDVWEFGWAYGVGWGAAIFLFGAIVLLLCDQEEEEIYYKERTIIHGEIDSRA